MKTKNQHMQKTNYILRFHSDYPANSLSANLPTPAGEKVASRAEIPGFNSIFAKIFFAKSDKFMWIFASYRQGCKTQIENKTVENLGAILTY
jgi:hypothetical protein